MNGDTPVKELTTRQLLWICGIFAGLLASMGVIYSSLIVPAIVHEVSKETVSREEWKLVLSRMDDDRQAALSKHQAVLSKLDTITLEVRELRRVRD